MSMKRTVVRYRTKPETVQENERLIAKSPEAFVTWL
jgi:hypothetical protein